MVSAHFRNDLEMCPVSPIFVTFALYMRCASVSTSSSFGIFSVFLRHILVSWHRTDNERKRFSLLNVLISIFVVVDLLAVPFVTRYYCYYYNCVLLVSGLVADHSANQ